MIYTGRFKDPTFEYGVALAELAGRTTLRMADATLLPFDFKSFSKTVNVYAVELSSLLEQARENTAVENQLIKEKHYDYAEDPTEKLLTPKIKDEVPYLNFASLQNALTHLEKTTAIYRTCFLQENFLQRKKMRSIKNYIAPNSNYWAQDYPVAHGTVILFMPRGSIQVME